MRNSNLICRFCLVALLLSFQSTTDAQKEEGQKIIHRYPLIMIDAQVVSRTTGSIVGELTHKDFIISENNIHQIIVIFQRLPDPLSLLILVDAATSHNNSHIIDNQLKALKSSLASHLKPEDAVSIMVMAEEPILLQDFTRNQQLINAALDRASQYKSVRALPAEKRFAVALQEAAKQAHGTQNTEACQAIILISALPKATADRVVLPEEAVKAMIESANIFYWNTPVHPTLHLSDVEKYSLDKISITALVSLMGGELVGNDWKSFFERLRERYRIGYPATTKGRSGELVRIKLELTANVKRDNRDLVLIYPRFAVIPPSR